MTTLEELNSQLDQLKSEFQEKAIFNKEELQRRQVRARSRHDPNQSFHEVGIRPLMITILEKINEGFTYNDFLGSAITSPLTPAVTVTLRKPQSMIDSELAKIDEEAHQQYVLDIKAAEEELLLKIAGINLDIADARSAERDRLKRQAALEREITKVAKELLPEVTEEVVPEALKE